MLSGEFYRFENGFLVACNDAVDEVRLAAADSWLVEAGRSRSIQAHFERFAVWVAEACPQLAQSLPEFFERVRLAIPTEGRWFPRIELHLQTASLPLDGIDSSVMQGAGGIEPLPALYLRLREAPEQAGSIALWTLPEPDPRTNPEVKGPDLSLCMQLRRKAILHNADEAVLLTADGYLEEGALSSIVWWRNSPAGDTLCAPDHSVPWLQSVTRNEVFALAQAMGFQTRVERVKPSDLVGLEIWALSSLHGIRPVSHWVNLGSPVGPIRHAESFQKRLRLLASQIN